MVKRILGLSERGATIKDGRKNFKPAGCPAAWDSQRGLAMIRRFSFEDEIHQNLGCVPLAVRRKLDRAGIKISLVQWQALSLGERLALCHLPVASEEEREALRIFTGETVRARSGSTPKPLPEAIQRAAEPPNHPPA